MIKLIRYVFWLSALLATAQEPSLEAELKSQTGFDRLSTLIKLSDSLAISDEKRSRKYAKQAYVMVNNILNSEGSYPPEQQQLLVGGLIVFGKSQFIRENYLDAKEIMNEASSLSSSIDFQEGIEISTKYIQQVDSLIENGAVKDNFFNRTLNEVNLNSTLRNSKSNLNASLAIKTGRILENRGDTLGAIEQYRKAAKQMKDNGELDKAYEIENKIATLQQIQLLEQIAALKSDELTILDTSQVQSLNLEKILPKRLQINDLESKARELENTKDYKQALTYYKEYIALQQKWERDSVAKGIEQEKASAELNRLKQESQIADLNLAAIQREKELQVRTKNILLMVASMILIFLLVMLFLYLGKRRKHSQLEIAYNQLDETKNELEVAENRISKLLQQQVSPEIASALIDEKHDKKKQFVAVMFLDIRGFTPIAERMEPGELIDYQNKVFGFMIEIIGKYHGNINQFMGDGFMATFGAPVSHGNDVRNAYFSGLEILNGIKKLNETDEDLPMTSVGIGIHAGDVVTGNVGTESRKQFSVTGNTVIIAARIEQLNKTYSSSMIISDEVFKKLGENDLAHLEFINKETQVKGRSEPIKIRILR